MGEALAGLGIAIAAAEEGDAAGVSAGLQESPRL